MVESFAGGHLRIVDRSEELGGINRAIAIDDHADAALGPTTAHVIFVVFGFGPQLDDDRWAVRPRVIGSSDVFTNVFHLIGLTRHQSPSFEAEVADVFSVKLELAVMLAQILTVLLSKAVETRVALNIRCAVAAAVRIDFLENSPGERGIRTKGRRDRHLVDGWLGGAGSQGSGARNRNYFQLGVCFHAGQQ